MSDEETWRDDQHEDEDNRDCVSPSEGTYGDDEEKEEDEMESPRCKTRRNVNGVNGVNGDTDRDEGISRIKNRHERLRSEDSEDDKPQIHNRSRGSVKYRTQSFEHSSDDGSKGNNIRTGISRDQNRPPRHGSQSATSDGEDHHQGAKERRQKWEKQASKDYTRRDSKPKAFGGSTGASALKNRFENKAVESGKVVTSSNRMRLTSGSTDAPEERQHSALSLKARFESKIQDNAPVKRNFVLLIDPLDNNTPWTVIAMETAVEEKINRSGGGAAKKFGGAASTSNKCFVCAKTVYPMEKLEADKHVYHKFCFKCKTCNRTVGLGNYAALAGDIYCKPHLKQLFKLKGNYDEGFGREQRKADWIKKDARQLGEEGVNGEVPINRVQSGEE